MSLTERYILLDKWVENMTRICRKMARGMPKLYIARGNPTIPPPTQVLNMAKAP